MSLIKCPECNKEISNKSTYCIHCGFPLDSLKTKCVIDGKEYDLSKTKSILESNNPQIEEIKKSLADEIGTNNLIYFKVTFLDEFARHIISTNTIPSNYSSGSIRRYVSILHCPRCGSTSITTGSRGVNWTLGLIGASQTVNRCGSCGYTWKPHK